MKNFKRICSLAFCAAIAFVLVGCKKTEEGQKDTGHTFNEYLTISPSNWNELTYQDNNDTEIMSYIGSSFFIYDFKFDSQGNIVDGDFEIEYSAATKLEDVTATYAGKEEFAVPADATSGYAYKITLRQDLKWDDGTAIKAEDFVYTMQEQLNPLFQNYRADSYYNSSTVIHNAENYAKQGTYAYSNMISEDYGDDEYVALSDFVKTEGGKYTVQVGELVKDVWFNINDGGNWGSNGLAAYYKAYGAETFGTAWETVVAAANEDGYVQLTDEYEAIISDMIAVLHGYANAEGYSAKAGEYAHQEWEEFCYYGYNVPKTEWSTVGMFVGDNEYEIVLVLDKFLDLLKEDGSLSYKAAYNMSSLPLVKKSLYESCKQAPTTGNDLWTSNYNSSLDTTASWGPYKLTYFQTDKSFTLEKNENWYGYAMKENEGLYETDKIECTIIEEYETAFMAFEKGQIDSIGVTSDNAATYKNSEQAIFTPDDFVQSLQLQSSYDALKEREKEGECRTLMAYTEFRNALSLAIDRDAYTQQCTTSSLAGYGIFTSVHYYDVENGGAYRLTDPARKTLCDVYGVDTSKFSTLTAAEESITGYDLTQARALVEAAYNKAVDAGDYKDGDTVRITYGTGSSTTSVMKMFNFIKDSWTELLKGTSLEGKLDMDFVEKGSTWAKDFRSGAYDVCAGGWTGAAWDPGYFLLAYLDSNYMYSAAWDTKSAQMTFTMPAATETGGDYEGAGQEFTMGLLDWYACLNGTSGCKHNWATGKIAEEYRLHLIAALEKEVLKVYYTVPLAYSFGCSLISYKWEYATRTYNTFMGYGGIKYLHYNYNNSEWAAFVQAKGGHIDYTA